MTTANTIALIPWTFSLIGDKGYLPLQSVTDRKVQLKIHTFFFCHLEIRNYCQENKVISYFKHQMQSL